MKKFLKNNVLTFIGAAAGSLAGYFYWKFVGCSSGSCSITSSPVNSSVYGALMGGLFLSLFQKNTPR